MAKRSHEKLKRQFHVPELTFSGLISRLLSAWLFSAPKSDFVFLQFARKSSISSSSTSLSSDCTRSVQLAGARHMIVFISLSASEKTFMLRRENNKQQIRLFHYSVGKGKQIVTIRSIQETKQNIRMYVFHSRFLRHTFHIVRQSSDKIILL